MGPCARASGVARAGGRGALGPAFAEGCGGLSPRRACGGSCAIRLASLGFCWFLMHEGLSTEGLDLVWRLKTLEVLSSPVL